MRNHLLRALAVAASAAVPAMAGAQTAPPVKFETFKLPNGLTFVVHEDHSAPIVAVNVWYDVGSANEAVRRSGFAHLFEHMLFQETENLPKGRFDQLLSEAGGQVNGTTNTDRTMYYEIVPSNRVNLALWLEAERMARLKVTKENFEREREVVKEERRTRIDNAPYGNGFLMIDTLHTDYLPYRHTVIGTMDDLNAATAQDVIDFYRQYYVPANATITLAGDITVEQAKKFANEYFADIPGGKRVAELPSPARAPRTDGERRQTVEDKLASVPLIFGAYNVPEHYHNDIYALQLLGALLGQGESSRLFQRLVKQEKAATFASSSLNTRWKGGYLMFQALPVQGVEPGRVESLLWEEVDKIRSQGVTQAELDKAKRQLIASSIMQRQMVLSKAEALQHSRLLHGDLNAINTDLDQYNKVTVADIKRVADKYLVTSNRTVVTVVPAAKKPTT